MLKLLCARQAAAIALLGLMAALMLGAAGSPRVAAAPIPAAATVLYDGGLGTKPAAQGWFYQGGGASETFGGGATTVDTTSNKSIMSGYFASQAGFLGSTAPVPVLDRAAGYTLTFAAQVEAEDHSGSDKNGDGIGDRAGFSVIALSSDKLGIELGFWGDQVWAQEGGSGSSLFTHAEGAAFSTTGLITYELTLYGDSYRLSSGGASILTGKVRDYTAFVGALDPYETPSFLFFGDDTSSASARFRIARIAIATGVGAGADLSQKIYMPLIKQ
jgi:hypothetical protein